MIEINPDTIMQKFMVRKNYKGLYKEVNHEDKREKS